MRHGRPTEAGTPVAASTGASRHSTTYRQDSGIPFAAELGGVFPLDMDRVRAFDENATAGDPYVIAEIIGDVSTRRAS